MVSWIIFSFFFILISAIYLFILDLANGPMYLLFLEIGVILISLFLRIIFRKKKVGFHLLSFLLIFVCNIPILLLAHPKVETFYPVSEVNETEVLHLKNGDIIGTYNEDKTVRIYAGIPYAEAPIGDLRWKEPVDKSDWSGVLDCTKFAPRAMQADESPIINTIVDIYAMGGWHPDYRMYALQEMSEDCLYLNIWRPNTEETNLPIVFYIHGGSLTTGASSNSDNNGETYAKNGVIMITIAYRLGVFGYFAHEDLISESPNSTTGNYGLLDQIKALEWVNDNAIYFGGDKNNITIAGESAGSSSVSAICSSPLAKGLFQKAIGESSSLVINAPPHTFRSLAKALEVGQNIMEEFKCSSVDELRNISASELVNTKFSNSSMTVDGYALEKTPYEVYLAKENNEVALLNGYNIKEADAFIIPSYLFSKVSKENIEGILTNYFDNEVANEMFTLYKDEIEVDALKVLNEIISVYWFINPHHSWSNMALNNDENVYRYYFTKENGYYGTYHSGEMIYAYGNLYRSNHKFAYDESDYKLQDIMVKYFTNFIKTGNPNGSGLPEWKKFDGTDSVLELGSNVIMCPDKYIQLYEIINNYLDKISE